MEYQRSTYVEIVILINQKEYYEGKVRQPCVVCGKTQKITDLWEPRWQWDMEGLLCKKCFDKKKKTW